MSKLAASITNEQGKTLADAEGELLRGLEVVEHACAIARHTENDPAAGLADRERMAAPGAGGRFPEFDAWHPWAIDADRASCAVTSWSSM